MPLFSCFSPFGQLEFSGDDSDAEKVYRSMVGAYTDPSNGAQAFDMTPGTHMEAHVYATAMAIADANAAVKRAGNQRRGATAYDMLPALEDKLGVTPGPTATISQRRAALVARTKLGRGARRESVEDALHTALGSRFVAYRPIAVSESTKWPAAPGTGPGVFRRLGTPLQAIRILEPVTTGATTVAYENIDTSAQEIRIEVGNVLCLDPSNLGLAERITITGSTGSGATREISFTAAKAHDEGCGAVNQAPVWWSNKRHSWIIVDTLANAADPEVRRIVAEVMGRLARGVSLWSVAAKSGANIGGFQLDVTPLGTGPMSSFPILSP